MSIVRAAAHEDLDAVYELETELFGPLAWSRQALRQEFDGIGGNRIVLVADAEPEIVGYGIVFLAGEAVDLQRIAVARSEQRKGVASDLFAALCTQARAAGAVTMLLEVAADNGAALAFYAGNGFAEVARRPRYYADGRTAVVMSAILEPVTRQP